MFSVGQSVKHVKSGNIYMIVDIPNNYAKLENINESFYVYTSIASDIMWYRGQTEMEERFVEVT